MNAEISVFLICVETITYLLIYNLHVCIFNTDLKPEQFLHISGPTGMFKVRYKNRRSI